MNILFFLTPKATCSFLEDTHTVRQALEKMEAAGYAALPILDENGIYCGSVNEGDLLWALKNQCNLDLKQAEKCGIMDIAHRKDNAPVSISTAIEDLLQKATDQNFVPVVDDRGAFIGIVTRKAILQYFSEKFIKKEQMA